MVLKHRTTRKIIRDDVCQMRWDNAHRGILIDQPKHKGRTVFVPFANVESMEVDEKKESDGRPRRKKQTASAAAPS